MTKLWDVGKVVEIHVNKHGQSYCYSIQQSSDPEGERRTLILCRWGKDRKTIKGFQRLFLFFFSSKFRKFRKLQKSN